MTDKIFEYKDDKDWYVGKIDGDAFSLSEPEGLSQLMLQLRFLIGMEDSYHIATGIIQYSSAYKFIRFYLELANELTGRKLQAVKRGETVLVTENDQLLLVHVSSGGVALADFFASDDKATFGDSILIATRNEGKTKEFRKMFERLGIAVENLNDYPDLPEVEETGTTFEENARLKAETISKLTGKMVLSDDSGLKVDVLGGMPGVWSARFSGPNATDEQNNAKLLHELAMVFEPEDRSAQFHTTLVVAAPDKESLVVEADWEGYIGFEPRGDNGFGYDPLFIVGQTGRTAAELSADEKNEQSHRGLAVKKLMEVFPQWQSNS